MTVIVSAIVAMTSEISKKIVTNSQINTLNGRTKQCTVYFYYSTDGALAVRVMYD